MNIPLSTQTSRLSHEGGAADPGARTYRSELIQTPVRWDVNGLYRRLFVAVIVCFPLSSAACGSSSVAASHASPSPSYLNVPSPTYSPVPSVSPVTPRQAKLHLQPTFTSETNSLGDVTYELRLDVGSNIPVVFDAYITFVGCNGQNLLIDPIAQGFEVRPSEQPVRIFTFPGQAPHCRYAATIYVPSYAHDATRGALQTDDYVRWVGGERGPLLYGNPQALPDPDHSAVLSLRATANFSH